MTLTEVKELQQSTILAMETLKEKVSDLNVEHERSLAIHSYKELEKFRDCISY